MLPNYQDISFFQELKEKEREPIIPRTYIDDMPIKWPENVDTTSPIWEFEVGLTAKEQAGSTTDEHWKPDPLRSELECDQGNRRQIEVILNLQRSRITIGHKSPGQDV